MNKTKVLLDKLLTVNNSFGYVEGSDTVMFFITDPSNATIMNKYYSLSTLEFVKWSESMNIMCIPLSVSEIALLSNDMSESAFEKLTMTLEGRSHSKKIKISQVKDILFTTYTIDCLIEGFKDIINILDSYKTKIKNSNKLLGFKEIQAIELLEKLNVNGRTDSQKLDLIKNHLNNIDSIIPVVKIGEFEALVNNDSSNMESEELHHDDYFEPMDEPYETSEENF